MERLIDEIEKISNQLCRCIDGDFSFKVRIDQENEHLEKLVLLINFVLEHTQRCISESSYNNRHLEQIVQNRTFELKLEKEKVEKASRAKDQFIANISHELRTPLNAILGTTQLLQRKAKDEETLAKTKTLYNSSEHLLSLLNDILDLSKIENEHLQLEIIPFNLVTELKNVLAWFKERAQERQIELRFDSQVDANDYFLGDPTRIKQISANLISNAIKFTPQGGTITVTLSLQYLENNDFTAVIQFCDTGIGIPKEAQEKIFEAFTQADNSTTRLYGGTGLGLTICLKLIKAMEGNITLSSEPGKGATFTISVPLKMHHVTKVAEPTKESPPPPRIESSTSPRILLAEDNTTNQIVAKELIESFGYTIEIANDGLEAVEMLRENPFDLVLMDCHMPRLNGFDAASAIRNELHYQGPIIALTADILEDTKEKVFQVGMNDFLSKPFNFDKLRETLDAYLKPRNASIHDDAG